MHIILGNYGNETIALLQWAKLNSLANVTVVSIDTAWQASSWAARIGVGEQLAKDYGFEVERLSAPQSFSKLVQDRGEFPTQKFQWCPALLKAAPLLTWLDEVDPACAATIIVGKMRVHSRASSQLTEFIAESEYFNERRVWHPLYAHSISERDQLIAGTGLDLLATRALECEPCIHSQPHELAAMSEADIKKAAALEKAIGKQQFVNSEQAVVIPIEDLIDKLRDKSAKTRHNMTSFDMGCGSPWGCGT